jgi:chaperone modulatory protein CbpM
MSNRRSIECLLLDEDGLTAEELAAACSVSYQWVESHLQGGLLGPSPTATRFTSVHLMRARRLVTIERTFDADEELAALVVDLIEEVERLRGQR